MRWHTFRKLKFWVRGTPPTLERKAPGCTNDPDALPLVRRPISWIKVAQLTKVVKVAQLTKVGGGQIDRGQDPDRCEKDRPAQSLEPPWGPASRLQRCSGSAATEQDLCKTVIATSKVKWATTLDWVIKVVGEQIDRGQDPHRVC